MLGHRHWLSGGKSMLNSFIIRHVSKQPRTASIFLRNESIFCPIASVL